jgi:hypothetical protein
MQTTTADHNHFSLMSKRIVTMACVFLLTMIITNTSHAEDENNPPPAYQHLKQLEPFVGKWQGKFDPPGNAPMGTVTVTNRWVGNKSYLLTEVLYTPDGTDVVLNQQTALIGYNWKTKSMHTWEFGWLMQSSAPVLATDMKLTIEGGEISARGADRALKTTTIELADPNTMITTSHLLKNGERELYEHLTLKRAN